MFILSALAIFFIIIGILGVHTAWRNNEWRLPLWELDYMLLEQRDPKYKRLNNQLRTKGTIGLLFIFSPYVIGAVILCLLYPKIWLIVILGLGFLWLLRGVVGLLRVKYSKKLRLLSYLYSPYFHAWRRNHLEKYTDEEVSVAVCLACGLDPKAVVRTDSQIKEFLVDLFKTTFPIQSPEKYRATLAKAIEIADNLRWHN